LEIFQGTLSKFKEMTKGHQNFYGCPGGFWDTALFWTHRFFMTLKDWLVRQGPTGTKSLQEALGQGKGQILFPRPKYIIRYPACT